MFNTQILAGSSGQGGGIDQQSLKFNDDESQYLSWTPAAAGNRKTWTWSGWVKKLDVQAGNGFLFYAGNGSSIDTSLYWYGGTGAVGDMLQLEIYDGTNNYYIRSAAKLRDTSAWYHIVAVMDTTQATSSDRMKLYVNGDQITDFNAAIYPTQNYDAFVNSNSYTHYIGKRASTHANILLADVYFIDGQALDASSFGETVDGYWKKKDYAGTYGTNGFHLTFQDDVVSEGFNTVTYAGKGAVQSVSGLGFSPDLVWTKERDGTSYHELHDTVRGANKQIFPNATDAEESTTKLTSFDGDGFSLAAHNSINESGKTYVGWCWDAGSGSPVSNTDGSITSTVKANPDYGFSVITYTGAGSSMTFGHGLGVEPELHFIKRRDSADEWLVYAQSLGLSQALNLHNANAAFSDSGYESISSTVIGIGNSGARNASGGQYVCYAFASVAGYSSIGSYSGTGASGNAVNCGFRPAWLLVKDTTSTGNWFIYDNTRSVDGTYGDYLRANLSDAEGNFDSFVATSTGFETLGSALNTSGNTFIYMAFADTREAAFWKDVSGQGNHWTPNNLDYRDSVIDSPANNFCTNNSVAPDTTGSTNHSFSEGNLKVSTSANDWWNTFGTIGVPSSGKYYWEYYALGSGSVDQNVGVVTTDWNRGGGGGIDTADAYSLYANSGGVGYLYTDGSNVNKGSGWFWTWGDIVNFAIDADTGKIWYGINGTWLGSGNPAAGTNEAHTVTSGDLAKGMLPAFSGYWTGGTPVMNFGQDSTFSGERPAGGNTDAKNIGDFAYAPPSGYLALCTANLPTPSVVDGSEYFNTVLYTGTGASTLSITGVGFQPDWVWAKKRSATDNHGVADVVRGVTKSLFPNTTGAESTDVNGLQSFDSDGFTIGSGSGSGVWGGNSGATYVAWNWKAGGTAVSNTAGSITSQVSANTDAGFSIVSYTGTGSAATIGHGLGVAPDLVIVKCRSNAIHSPAWPVWHKDLASTAHYLDLQTTAASASAGAALWNNTAPTSSVFSVGTTTSCNGSGFTYISYCFANSDTTKVGSYTGNGSSDGPFVYTGFEVSWVMAKRTDSADSWCIWDIKRTDSNGGNVIDKHLRPDSSSAESDPGGSPAVQIDALSNGFKLRESNGQVNASGGTYIFLAFAKNPFKYATAR